MKGNFEDEAIDTIGKFNFLQVIDYDLMFIGFNFVLPDAIPKISSLKIE